MDRSRANTHELELFCYRGDNHSPNGSIPNQVRYSSLFRTYSSNVCLDKYSKLCTVYGDIYRAPVPPPTSLETGETCYVFDHFIILRFSDNELSAFFSWKNTEKAYFHCTSMSTMAYRLNRARGSGRKDLGRLYTIPSTHSHR